MITIDFSRPLVEQFGDNEEVRALQKELDSALPYETRLVRNKVMQKLLENFIGSSVRSVTG